ncbi:terminase small subunit [Veillonella criceti]|uniref:Terminase small subunit n=1 Tax=Veillonella criceti TaxID=103891 RepID=A0A380NJZ0_9FIRM|nr:terminase small subunit [Veillonella criceti]SUP42273.1 Terminase small subunit [Veillonella criceti]
MTPKQDKFCVEYLIDLNGTQAAIRAGYSPKTADRIANQNLRKLEIQNRIKELRQKEFKSSIATAEEVEAMLSAAMRGELEEEVVVVESSLGISTAKKVRKQISAKDRLKAAELMGKRHQLFTDKLQVAMEDIPVIVDDIDDE